MMKRFERSRWAWVPAVCGLWVACSLVGVSPLLADEPDPEKLEFFEKRIRPLLVGQCHACHAAETKPAGGLRVDDFHGLLAGGNSGAGIVPGKSDESLLIQRVTDPNENRRMPREGRSLTEEEIADLRYWIEDGAAWPPQEIPEDFTGQEESWYAQLREDHWAWQPLGQFEVPQPSNRQWARDAIDQFVLARLEAAELKPVGDADKLALLRRVTFDLTGLPPTEQEIDSFLEDESSQAWERVVDRLLASTAFGERWGRHWLDVARYAESTGPSRNIPYPFAWNYRDYVIDSINADIPYNRFVQEQIAGDLLPAETDQQRDRLAIATGFLALGVKDVNQRFENRFDMDNVDDQIDVVTRSILATTVTCARCHDHKFDPIPTTDYYALAGIFTSTVNAAGVRNQMGGSGMAYYVPKKLVHLRRELPEPPADVVEELTAKVAKAKEAWDAIRGTPEGLKLRPNGQPFQRRFRITYENLQAELNALTDRPSRGGAVHGARDAETIADAHVRIRGETEQLGPLVPRGFLTAFEVPDAPEVNPEQSGRLELAQWLISRQNPLTPRVAVNRIWHHLFGRGLVSTVDNFGYNGNVPTHPELLDYLASQFVEDDWSLKRLIRRLVLTRTYQLSAEVGQQQLAVDPANRLLWRHSPRRLSAEEIRDSILAASGQLDPQRPEGSPTAALPMREIRDDGPEANQLREAADRSRYRSVYLPLLRGIIPRPLEVFDPVEQTLVTGARQNTTVPSQALFLLNSTFVRWQSLELAQRLQADMGQDDSERIRTAYRLILGRHPDSWEIEAARDFIANYSQLFNGDSQTFPITQPLAVNAEPGHAEVAGVRPTTARTETEDTVPDAGASDGESDEEVTSISDAAVVAADSETQAWLAFLQALFGSAEFRHTR
jgi:hypothetical protein